MEGRRLIQKRCDIIGVGFVLSLIALSKIFVNFRRNEAVRLFAGADGQVPTGKACVVYNMVCSRSK